MASGSGSSAVDLAVFQFNNLKLPKKIHVLEYVRSRTKQKFSMSFILSSMVKEVHSIWTRADCPPKSLKSILNYYKQMLLEKKKLEKRKKMREEKMKRKLEKMDKQP